MTQHYSVVLRDDKLNIIYTMEHRLTPHQLDGMRVNKCFTGFAYGCDAATGTVDLYTDKPSHAKAHMLAVDVVLSTLEVLKSGGDLPPAVVERNETVPYAMLMYPEQYITWLFEKVREQDNGSK